MECASIQAHHTPSVKPASLGRLFADRFGKLLEQPPDWLCSQTLARLGDRRFARHRRSCDPKPITDLVEQMAQYFLCARAHHQAQRDDLVDHKTRRQLASSLLALAQFINDPVDVFRRERRHQTLQIEVEVNLALLSPAHTHPPTTSVALKLRPSRLKAGARDLTPPDGGSRSASSLIACRRSGSRWCDHNY